MDILTLAEYVGRDLAFVASLYYGIMGLFKLDHIFDSIRREVKRDQWEVLSYTYLEKDVWYVKRELVKKAVSFWVEGMSCARLEKTLEDREPHVVRHLRELRDWMKRGEAHGLGAWSVALRRLKEALL
jgi:NAD-specific glutamate dehydrogenase